MRILIVYPAVSGLKNGNLVTAQRWRKRFGELGHAVEIASTFAPITHPGQFDALVALHAEKSATAIDKFSRAHPACSIIVAVTGTDIYDPQSNATVQRSLALADHIVVLQTATADDVPAEFQKKVKVIFQSIDPFVWTAGKPSDHFEVCVVGHLRTVKDPFQAARAARCLPQNSLIRVTQIGGALTDSMHIAAEQETQQNARYRWLGEISHDQSLQHIAHSDLLINSSKIEGGAAVICEAVVYGTPILATRVAGNFGFLGDGYEGLFDVGDTESLTRLMLAAETDRDFYQRLKQQCDERKHLFQPDFERRTWAELLRKLI